MLHYRSHTWRSNRAWLARLSWIALVLISLCVTGCQNNAERDLIARDRRLEEDQLYAMQDYISQYQQLVCRYRSENASLRRQLNETRTELPEQLEPEPQPLRRPQPISPNTNKGPMIETPAAPNTGEAPGQPPKIEAPDVPPLNNSTMDDGERFHVRERDESVTSYDEPAEGRSSSATTNGSVNAGQPIDPLFRKAIVQPPSGVLLSGEVVANDNGGGPRIVIDVQPRESSGRDAPFDGHVSLMLVSVDTDGRQNKLARWDFGPQDVRAAFDAKGNGQTMRFHVELPADTKVGGNTELWVRLAANGGNKLLSHASVDLTRPGVFSSNTDMIRPRDQSVVAASYEQSAAEPGEVPAPLNEGKWATAAPDKPANLPVQTDDASGGWKASSEPMPLAVVSAIPTAPTHQAPTPSHESKGSTPNSHAGVEVAAKPVWAPERSGSSSAARPTWSPTR
ncbi:MAG TPA: hypothetical protein VFW73_04765 [Lacipirellulaceae bacterium]|nr:hypothetical protein [Lacipirellulaceae bacterium]